MRRLLIDIGNTRMKGCIAIGEKLCKIKVKDYNKSFFKKDYTSFLTEFGKRNSYSARIYKNRYSFDEVYISLLDNKYNSRLASATHVSILQFINTQIPLPIRIDYSETLGSDRICSAVGAYSKFKKKDTILIIDFGTATTFNIVSKGVYKGGMISTGIKTSAEALKDKTSLPGVSLKSVVRLINKDTKNAITSGLVFQQVLFIQKAIEEYKKLYKDLYVVATGGGMELMKKYRTGIDRYEQNLVLEGLNKIAIYNETI